MSYHKTPKFKITDHAKLRLRERLNSSEFLDDLKIDSIYIRKLEECEDIRENPDPKSNDLHYHIWEDGNEYIFVVANDGDKNIVITILNCNNSYSK